MTESVIKLLGRKTMSTETIKLRPLTLNMIETLTPLVTLNAETGLPQLPETALASALPEGQTVAELQQYQNSVVSFEAAANYVLGQQFVNVAQTNPELQNYTSKLPVGNDTYQVSIARDQSIPTGIGSDAGKRIVHAHVTSSVRSPRPEVKRAIAAVREMGEVLRVAQG